MEKEPLKRDINLFGGVAILSGIMVGSGIFFIGSYVLMRLEFSLGLALLVWLIGGLITLGYGLIYAELGTMLPKAGGYYVYLREAFGKPLAFMSGFMNLFIASSGSIAALAIAFSLILHNMSLMLLGVAIPTLVQILLSVVMIVGLSILNFFGIRLSTAIMKVFLVLKAIPILLVLVVGLLFGTQTVELSFTTSQPFFTTLAMIGYAVIATFWAYEGWTNLNNVAGEIDNPQRNLPLALIISILSITALYVLYQYSLFNVLSVVQMQDLIANGEIYLGINATAAILGSVGMYIVMGTMLISVLGALNAVIMTFPRVYYAMSKDGLLFESFKKVHPTHKTPTNAIIASGIISIMLLVFGLDNLISLVAFGALVFNTLIFIGLFRLRKKRPDLERPYKVWGYPILPVIIIGITVFLLVAIFMENIVPSLYGTGLILLGLPVYYAIERFKSS